MEVYQFQLMELSGLKDHQMFFQALFMGVNMHKVNIFYMDLRQELVE